jgi:hypothetical protein
MRRNLQDEKDLREYIKQIDTATYNLKNKLHEIFSLNHKNYLITYRGKIYDIHQPTNKEDERHQKKIRNQIIKGLLKDCYRSMVNGYYLYEAYNVITAFTRGAELEDHQIDKSERVVYTPDLDKDGNQVTAKPLNQDSIYVQWQDISKYPIEGEEQC